MACSVKQRNSRVGNGAVGATLEVEFCLHGACGLGGAADGGSRALRAGGCCEKAAVQSIDIL